MLTSNARSIFLAGVQAVRGDSLMQTCVQVAEDCLQLGEITVPRSSFDRLVIVGAGKASGAMAIGLVQRLRSGKNRAGSSERPWTGELEILGHVNVPEGCQSVPHGVGWPEGLKLFAARPEGVNEPTETAIVGTQRILELLGAAGPRDLVVVLISGGGSALLCCPTDGIGLAEKLAVIRKLSGSGADIGELNTVRKHLSKVKGGGLARACRSRGDSAPTLVSMVLSDVLGDPLDLIASGPTVPDSSIPADALRVLERFDPERELPDSVYRVLESSSAERAEMPRSPVAVVGNNAVAVDVAGITAESLDYNHVMHAGRASEGSAESVGEHLAEMTLAMLRRDQRLHRQDALITGGEPTVRLADAAIRGRGGRNQQLVLAAYRRLLEIGLSDAEWSQMVILSGGTDGEDGPTDAAGAWIDGDVHRRAQELGLSPTSWLERNDAYSFFEQTGGLLLTGPTGTNVCDLRVALVGRER